MENQSRPVQGQVFHNPNPMMNLNQVRPTNRQRMTIFKPPADFQQGLTSIKPNNKNSFPIMNFNGINFLIFPKGSLYLNTQQSVGRRC